MAIKTVRLGSFGPFRFDDTTYSGVETDGDVKANNLVTAGLSANTRIVVSDANKQLSEIDDLTQWIAGGNQIQITDDGDGTISIQVKNLIEINNITGSNSPYDISISAYRSMVIVDASANAVTVNLPPAANWAGQTIIVKKTDNVNNVTIQANGTENIDGSNSDSITGQYGSATYISDGTDIWKV